MRSEDKDGLGMSENDKEMSKAGNSSIATKAKFVAAPPPLTKYPAHYPPFPEPGSLLGGRYFVLQRLGQGTFCSIHKCVDLSYNQSSNGPCVVAAKVELSNFVNSGVLEGEATVLRHLHLNMPPNSVPLFAAFLRSVPTKISKLALGGNGDEMGAQVQPLAALQQANAIDDESVGDNEVSTTNISAILMEYLPGEDMARLRDRCCLVQKHAVAAAALRSGGDATSVRSYSAPAASCLKNEPAHGNGAVNGTHPPLPTTITTPEAPDAPSLHAQTQATATQHPTRRVNLRDAVYMCADVLLPLLKHMHDAGIIHRDIKPSNVVRTGTTSANKGFKLVDFGLSKSFVVPHDSPFADKSLPWDGPSFSMTDVATPISPDELPSKSSLFQRKERPTAEFRGTSMYASLRVHELRDYCRRDDLWSLMYVFCDFCAGGLPWMYAASQKDKDLVVALKETCHSNSNENVEGLLYGPAYHAKVTAVTRRLWPNKPFHLSQEEQDALKVRLPNISNKVQLLRNAFNHLGQLGYGDRPDYNLIEDCLRGFIGDESTPEGETFEDVPELDWNMSDQHIDEGNVDSSANGTFHAHSLVDHFTSTFAILPPDLLLNLKVAKAEYNALNAQNYFLKLPQRKPLLLDWLECSQVAHHPWDVTTREKWGEHRSSTDGYRREEFLNWIERCAFEFPKAYNHFVDPEYYSESLLNCADAESHTNGIVTEETTQRKKRKFLSSHSSIELASQVSRAMLSLTSVRELELTKQFAPPPKISFFS